MDGRGAPLDRRYSFTRQRERQLFLSASFSVLCAANLVDNLLFGGQSTYDTLLYAVSLCGILAAILGSVGVLFHSKELLSLYLVYILCTLAFCVLYHVFQLGTRGAVHDFILLGLSVLMVVLIWVQLFYAMFFLRLLTLYDVYHSHPKSEVEAIPTEDLAALFAQLQQRPKWSQMVELLSMLGSGKENFTFDEFCQMESRLDRMERRARREERKRRRRQQQRDSQQQRPSVREFQSSIGDGGVGGAYREPLLREDRLHRGAALHRGPPTTTGSAAASGRGEAAVSTKPSSVASRSSFSGYTVATSPKTKRSGCDGGGSGISYGVGGGSSGGGGGGDGPVMTFTVTAEDLEQAQSQLEQDEAARMEQARQHNKQQQQQRHHTPQQQAPQQPVMRIVMTKDDLAQLSQMASSGGSSGSLVLSGEGGSYDGQTGQHPGGPGAVCM